MSPQERLFITLIFRRWWSESIFALRRIKPPQFLPKSCELWFWGAVWLNICSLISVSSEPLPVLCSGSPGTAPTPHSLQIASPSHLSRPIINYWWMGRLTEPRDGEGREEEGETLTNWLKRRREVVINVTETVWSRKHSLLLPEVLCLFSPVWLRFNLPEPEL